MGWLFIEDPDCALDPRAFICAGVLDGGPLMLAKEDLLFRGDMFRSDVDVSAGRPSDRVIGRHSTELSICGEPIADWRLWPLCCSMLLTKWSPRSGLLTNLSSLLRRLGLTVLSSFRRLPSAGRVRYGNNVYRMMRDVLLGSCLALKSSR
jgi:hypothetical protein